MRNIIIFIFLVSSLNLYSNELEDLDHQIVYDGFESFTEDFEIREILQRMISTTAKINELNVKVEKFQLKREVAVYDPDL